MAEQVGEVSATAGSYALLTDGSTVCIRPARPGDIDAVRAMHAAMSADNMYLRFFSLSLANADREAQRVCRATGPDHMALLAWSRDTVVGVASYEVTGQPREAEVAFAVADQMHGHGIATLLLDHLVLCARQHQIRAFTAETLLENSAMLRVFADVGLPVRRHASGGTVELVVPTRPTTAIPCGEPGGWLSASQLSGDRQGRLKRGSFARADDHHGARRLVQASPDDRTDRRPSAFAGWRRAKHEQVGPAGLLH
jgi:GNAT superfamily N-acetyltransferase